MITLDNKPLFLFACIIIALCSILYIQFKYQGKVERRLQDAESKIQLMQKQNAMTEKIIEKWPQLLKTNEKEYAKLEKQIDDVIKSNSDWADQSLPFDINSMFFKNGNWANSIPSTSSVAR